jgi:ribosomal peptide maturation radical SAM protein 1
VDDRRDDQKVDICIVVPPFADIATPPLGSAILAAACKARGLSVRVLHGNILLASLSGYDAYRAVSDSSIKQMVGERLFRDHAYPAAMRARLGEPGPVPEALKAEHDAIAPTVGPFLDALTEQIVALAPRILGISSVFQQNLASAALALRVKAAAPEICIVLGGANIASPMGEALADIFTGVDHFFSGEADIAFPDFCERYVLKGERPAARVVHCEPIRDMRVTPTPDFSDFFADLRAAQARRQLPPELPYSLPMESSRGCWWGAKNHCTFCGLNGETMSFREKPAALILEEFDAVGDLWGVKRFMLADNIMPLRYLKDLLPVLAEREERPNLFYEVKANLTHEQLDLMARAGIDAIQPGIESLSSSVLRLMRKGVSGLQNIMLLRDSRSFAIRVVWNYLYGLPGETAGAYRAVLDLMPRIEHLQAPSGMSGIVIDRFSPYFNDPATFGIADLTPIPVYRALYPDAAALDRIAYHFMGRYSTELLRDPALLRALEDEIERWKQQWARRSPPVLAIVKSSAAGAMIADTRRVARQPLTIIAPDRVAALRSFERPVTRGDLDPALAAHAEWFLARDMLIEHEGKLLNVVTHAGTRASPALQRREQQKAAGLAA